MRAAIGDLGVHAEQQETAEREGEACACARADGFAQCGASHGGAEPAGETGQRFAGSRGVCWQSSGSASGLAGGVDVSGRRVTQALMRGGGQVRKDLRPK